MAAPVLTSSLWNSTTHVLTLLIDQASTFTGAVYDFQYTDADGAVWANASAAFASGSGTTTPTVQLSAYPAGTPGDASTLDVAASAFTAAATGNDAITDDVPNLAIDHPIPITRTDIEAFAGVVDQILSDTDLSSYDDIQIAGEVGAVDAKDPVHLVRPDELIGAGVPGPVADLGDLLRATQAGLTGAQGVFRRFAAGDIDQRTVKMLALWVLAIGYAFG